MMTWEELLAQLTALSPEELKEPVLVFDNNEGVTLRVLRLVQTATDENADCYLTTE